MVRIFSKILKRNDARSLMQEVIHNHRYNHVNVPLPIENNYFMDQNYALFLTMDAFIKFDILMEDMNFIGEYISQLHRIMKRMTNYQDITRGIHQLICRMVAKKLEINNYKSNESKERILRYIYKKYVVEGYFYYGFSSIYKKEIDSIGIQKSGFILDSRLEDINDIIKKYEGKDVLKRVESDITDNFVIASYFAFLGPDYLEKFVSSGIFTSSCYDNSCFYTKDVGVFKNNLDLYTRNKHFNIEDKVSVINSFLDVWNEDRISNSYGCVAFIKRSYLNRNYLKDIEEIIRNCKDTEIETSIAMIMESRYSSYEFDHTISPLFYEVVEIPSYSYLAKLTNEDFIDNYEDICDLKMSPMEEHSKTKQVSTSYGFASTIMLLGLLLISLGSTITIILTSLGR